MADTEKIVAKGNTASFAKFAENIETDVRLSQHGSLFVTPLEPKYMELARIKRLYAANTGAANSEEPLTALPTTTATWALYNPATSTRVLVVLQASCYSTSGTLGLGMAIALGVPQTLPAAVTAYASSVNNAIIPGSTTGNGVFATGATVADTTWSIHEARAQVAAVEVGSGLVTELDGLYVLAPGQMLGGAVIAPVGTTALFGFGYIWAELDLDM